MTVLDFLITGLKRLEEYLLVSQGPTNRIPIFVDSYIAGMLAAVISARLFAHTFTHSKRTSCSVTEGYINHIEKCIYGTNMMQCVSSSICRNSKQCEKKIIGVGSIKGLCSGLNRRKCQVFFKHLCRVSKNNVTFDFC